MEFEFACRKLELRIVRVEIAYCKFKVTII